MPRERKPPETPTMRVLRYCFPTFVTFYFWLRERLTLGGAAMLVAMPLLVPALYASRLRTRNEADHDLRSEFPTGRLLNRALGGVMSAERALIRSGLSLPVGGSLLLIARRPAVR